VKEKTVAVKKINIAVVMLLVASLISSIILISQCFSPSIIGDEIFSLRLISFSFGELISLTARDVHPPLYYIILKLFVEGGALVGISAISIAKLCSVAPVIILQIISLVQVIKKKHIIANSLFSILIVVAPRFVTYSSLIRMYSWGMFFLVMAYLCAEKIVLYWNKDEFQNGYKHEVCAWCEFVFWALCGAYTQYFVLVAVTGIYFYILVEAVIHNKCKHSFKSENKIYGWIVATGASILLYMPWLFVAIKQVTTVNGGYWIPSISARNFIDYFQFMFNANAYYYHAGTIWGILLAMSLVATIFFWYRTSGHKDRYLLCGVLLPLYMIMIGVGISIISQPIFAERYIFLTNGVFWFAVSRVIEKIVLFDADATELRREKVFKRSNDIRRFLVSILVVLLVTFTYINLSWFVRTEKEYKDGWTTGIEYLTASLQSEDVLLSNEGSVGRTLSYLYPDNQVGYYWRKQTDPLFLEMHSNFRDLRDVDVILNFMKDANSLWLVDVNTSDEFHFVEDLGEKANDLEIEKVGTYNIEGLIASLYNIRWK